MNTVIVKLKGGLGNQMFQYAFAKILAKKNNVLLKLDTEFFKQDFKNIQITPREFSLEIFNDNLKVATSREIDKFKRLTFFGKIRRKLGLSYPKLYLEPSLRFQAEAMELRAPVYLDGYFQSYKYYIHNEAFVKKLFRFPLTLVDEKNKTLFKKIQQTNSISIHVRRGDYINNSKTSAFHGTCTLSYYHRAIDFFLSRISDVVLYFFSDDMDWVKENFAGQSYKQVFIEYKDEGSAWLDLMLMSNCKHNIIANSTFSWWGAYLNDNPDKIVIAPKKWFLSSESNEKAIDIIPVGWQKM